MSTVATRRETARITTRRLLDEQWMNKDGAADGRLSASLGRSPRTPGIDAAASVRNRE
jgi:hypothetical protein